MVGRAIAVGIVLTSATARAGPASPPRDLESHELSLSAGVAVPQCKDGCVDAHVGPDLAVSFFFPMGRYFRLGPRFEYAAFSYELTAPAGNQHADGFSTAELLMLRVYPVRLAWLDPYVEAGVGLGAESTSVGDSSTSALRGDAELSLGAEFLLLPRLRVGPVGGLLLTTGALGTRQAAGSGADEAELPAHAGDFHAGVGVTYLLE